jgi:hypothetical protein
MSPNWRAVIKTAGLLLAAWSVQAAELEILRVGKITTSARHNAFTGLARFKDAFYCAWRAASSHVSADGKLRVVRSADGTNWTPVALMTRAGADLRDAKLEVTPDQRLSNLVATFVTQESSRFKYTHLKSGSNMRQ